MSGPPIAVEKEIKQLLEIAGTASDEAARSWLIGEQEARCDRPRVGAVWQPD
jgi:hypothetical protein